MNEKIFYAILVLAITGLVLTSSAGAELYENTSFEANDDGWPNEWIGWAYYYPPNVVGYVDVEVDSPEAHSGNNYAHMYAAGSTAYIFQRAQGQPGRDYRISVWARDVGSSVTDPCGPQIGLALEFRDETSELSKTTSWISVASSWAEYSYTLPADPCTIEAIGLVVASTPWAQSTQILSLYVDDAGMQSIDAWGPNPAHESSIDPASISKLSWGTGELAVGTITFDVWFDPNGGSDLVLIADDWSGNDVNLPEPLKDDMDYNWRVDTTDDTGTYTGLSWTFDTQNVPPTVDAGEWQYVWLSMDDGFDDDANSVTVQLDAGYTDDGKPGPVDPCDIRWEVTETSGEWSTEDPNTLLNPVITLYDQVGYQITFTVPDGLAEGSGDMWINVSENGCTAAFAKEGDDDGEEFDWSPLQGDANNDCEVTIEDIVLMAFDWMGCNRLDCL